MKIEKISCNNIAKIFTDFCGDNTRKFLTILGLIPKTFQFGWIFQLKPGRKFTDVGMIDVLPVL